MWWAFAPVWRLVVGLVIGHHDQAQADRLVEQVAWVTDDTIPFFTSDQWPADPQALLKIYGEWYCPEPPAGPSYQRLFQGLELV